MSLGDRVGQAAHGWRSVETAETKKSIRRNMRDFPPNVWKCALEYDSLVKKNGVSSSGKWMQLDMSSLQEQHSVLCPSALCKPAGPG